MKKREGPPVSVSLTVLTGEPDLQRRWHIAGPPWKPEPLASTDRHQPLRGFWQNELP